MNSSRSTQTTSTRFTPAHIKEITSWGNLCGAASLAAALGEKFTQGFLSVKQENLLLNDVNEILIGPDKLLNAGELRELLNKYFQAPIHLQFIFGLCFYTLIKKVFDAAQQPDASELIDSNGLMGQAALEVIANRYGCNVHFFAQDEKESNKIYPLENKINVSGATATVNILYKKGSKGHYNLLGDTPEDAFHHNAHTNNIVATPSMPVDAPNKETAKADLGKTIAKCLTEMRKRNFPKNTQPHDTGIGLGLTASAPPARPSLAEYEKLYKQKCAKQKNLQSDNTSSFSGADSKRSDDKNVVVERYSSYFFPKQIEGSSNKFVGETINISLNDQIELDALYARLDSKTLDNLLERQQAAEGNSQPIRQKK